MRKFFLGLVLMLSVSSVASHVCGATVRIANAGLSGELLPIWIAQDRGLFKKHGLDTEVITIQSGPLAVQALLGGSVQFHAGGTSSPMESKMRGSNVVTVASFINSLPYTLVSSAPIKSANQLKGKRFAVSRLGSISDLSLRIALRNLGINPEKEAIILGIGDQTARFAALRTNAVDATVISPPLTVTARKLAMNIISSFQDAGIVWAYDSIDITQEFGQKNRRVVMSVLRGFVEAIAYIHKNKGESLATLQRWMRLNDREALDETYHYLIGILPKKLYSIDKGVQAVIDAIPNRPARKFAPQDFYDMSYLKELDQSGFLDRIFQ